MCKLLLSKPGPGYKLLRSGPAQSISAFHLTLLMASTALLLALAALLYFGKVKTHCDVLVDELVDCGYYGISQLECLGLNCCWRAFSSHDLRNPPWCFKPADPTCGYRRVASNDQLVPLCEAFGDPVQLQVLYPCHDIARITVKRPTDLSKLDALYPAVENISSDEGPLLSVQEYTDPTGLSQFKVLRRESPNHVLFNTLTVNSTIPSGFRLTKQYSSVGTQLQAGHFLYGVGYRAGRLRLLPGSVIAAWAFDQPTANGQNLYGAHPFYIQIIEGKAHGIYLRSSFGLDVVVGTDYLQFKVLGGPIDIFVLAGPSPLQVMEQYTRLVGRPARFDYRMLGFHQSRYGYPNISHVEWVVDTFNRFDLPLDGIWLDIDHMDRQRDFTFDPQNFPIKEVQRFARLLETQDRLLIPILDPGIATDIQEPASRQGLDLKVFIENPAYAQREQFYRGLSWAGSVNFVDFSHPNASDYWKFQLKGFIDKINCTAAIGGFWLDMNEPSNFINGYDDTYYDLPDGYRNFSVNFPRYLINNGQDQTPLYFKTVPMDTVTAFGDSFEAHNMYGFFESQVSYDALRAINPQMRPFLLTRSTFPGSGRYTATWLGDNFSTFSQLALSVSGVLLYQILGVPSVGPDACGFLGSATEELCARWMALAAFYPFARNHNSLDSSADQEPFRWTSVAKVMRKYFRLRYALLPYWYTLMQRSHETGHPYWRPMWFEYPLSLEALQDETQFFLGPSLLLAPVLEASTSSSTVTLQNGEWYEWESFTFLSFHGGPISLLVLTPWDILPIYIRAGAVIPMMLAPANTMAATRKSDMFLFIALDSRLNATGQLYWDDGVSEDTGSQYADLELHVDCNQSVLKISASGHMDGDASIPAIANVTVLTAHWKLVLASSPAYQETRIHSAHHFSIHFKQKQSLAKTIEIPLLMASEFG